MKATFEGFSDRPSTAIYRETASSESPYHTEEAAIYGYDLLSLVSRYSFVDVLFLMLSGALPTAHQSVLLNTLMVSFSNLGPRHPAIRAAMVTGVCKTRHEHILPVGLLALGGAYVGANGVAAAHKFIAEHHTQGAVELANTLYRDSEMSIVEGDSLLCSGFGSLYGGVDRFTRRLGKSIEAQIDGDSVLSWALDFGGALHPYHMGCLVPSIVAAVGIDLGLGARESMGLFQITCAPGVLAHGLEQSHKPITSMPFVDDQHVHYVSEK